MQNVNVDTEIILNTIESIAENSIKRNSELLEKLKINSEENSNNETSITA